MGDEENKEEVKCEECSCAGWKAGFAIFVVLSVIMFILCIVIYVKRNAIHAAVDRKLEKVADKISSRSKESAERLEGREKRRRRGGEFFEEGLEGGFEELSAMLSSSNRYC